MAGKTDSWVGTSEAASALAVTASRVRQMIAAGEIAANKIGRDHLIPRAELRRLMKAGRRGPGRPRKKSK